MARGTAPPLNPTLLRDARGAARMSQRDLARAVGTTRHQIIRYENGAERPEIGRLAALARACEVTVDDLVDEEDLPSGLAGLRIGAGLTMAAAAAGLAEHIDPATGIATNRASLSGAERGRMPLSWRPTPAGSRVRGAMAATYEVDIDAVRAAWSQTFPDNQNRPAVPREEANHQGESETGSLNATSAEAVTQTPPPPLAKTATAVLVSGNPNADHPYLRIEVNGDTIGHLADLHTWNHGTGWAFYPRLTEQHRRTLSRVEEGARPPTATTTKTDIAEAVGELLPQVLEGPVRIEALHGRHTGLVGLHPQHMEAWELHRGRVKGREDVYARGRCWGWLQPATDGGRTAHTADGPVPGGPWATREEAAVALWAHLNAPLPPPNLGEQARTKRRIRAPRDARPLCPYTDAELARVRLIRDDPADSLSPYRAESPADHRVLGYVWRKDARRWSYAPATGRPPEYSPALPTAPTRAAALKALLAQPGPLWADPNSAILH